MGSTPTRYAYGRLLRNHPHVYGEYATPVEFPKSLSESPPCVWGVRFFRRTGKHYDGITPMCMGSTCLHFPASHSVRNHPHVYGEYSTSVTPAFVVLESPPCVWGVQFARVERTMRCRITPMCMGSTAILSFKLALRQNHPHVYEEYFQ